MTAFRHIPKLTLKCGSNETIRSLADIALSVRVQDRLSAPRVCEILLQADEASEPIPMGAAISIGFSGATMPLFDGTITAISREKSCAGNRQLRLRAYDALHGLRLSQTPRGFSNRTTAQIAAQILSEHGLTLQTVETGPKWRRILQTRQSDLVFLRELTEKSGLYFSLRGDTVHLVSLAGAVEDIPKRASDCGIIEFQLHENINDHFSSVRTNTWTPRTAATDIASATVPRAPRPAYPVGPDLHLFGAPSQSGEHATAMAQSALDQNAAKTQHLWAKLDGDEALCVGTKLEWTEATHFGPDVFLLTEVTHTLDTDSGFLTEISTLPPARIESSTAAEVTMGIVKSVADPKKMGRVQIALTAFGDLRTDWLEVALPGAGPRKGLIALPANRDRVLVLLAAGDPAQGVVIGCLFGETPPNDVGVDGEDIARFLFQTPSGHKLTLNDADDTVTLVQREGASIKLSRQDVRIEARNGSYLSLSSGETVLHSESDLVLTAPGKAIKIAGNTVDFEKL
jgi:uncharacterized protein involved in type VI secretion and phage assembly